MKLSNGQKGKILDKLQQEGAISVSVFGSFARDEANEESDIDILVEFESPKSLIEISRIQRELEGDLGREIDLVTENSLSPYIRERMDNLEVLMA